MDKYEILTAMAKALDERDHLREENDMLERHMHEYKVSTGSEKLSPQMFKVYEYGVECLFKKCFNPDWYNIGVKESGGVPYPDRSLGEWSEDIYRNNSLPRNFSMGEIFDVCGIMLQNKYDEMFKEELQQWREKQKGGEGGDGDDE